MNGRYFLDRDDDCHWYVIRADKRDEWNKWVDLSPDSEESWDVPDFAMAIDNPSKFEFFLAENQ